ncbi:MAG TPA: biotin-dependent carboxyltransferase family protein [Solirubrobacteraceae bacterium]|nr:biotin-dependent carboxyltransferase family protein [Solirubrobacteraceae bacterium]
MTTTLEVLAPGALTTIQDLGRPGWGHIGVPRSGAADRPALIEANRLVGNPDGAAALETTLVGPRLRFGGHSVIALTGAATAARLGERPVPMGAAVAVAAGEELRLGTARAGLRTYLALAGGIAVGLTLGSAATDLLTGLGPPPLRRGDVLRLGPRAGAPAPRTARRARSTADPAGAEDEAVLRVLLGPRDDWFTAAALTRLLTEPFAVGPSSNRVGLRLRGPALERRRRAELRSEGLVPGAIQVPPDGQPILLLADHPTTGGYPVIAVVLRADLALAAQRRPDQALRFALATPGG